MYTWISSYQAISTLVKYRYPSVSKSFESNISVDLKANSNSFLVPT